MTESLFEFAAILASSFSHWLRAFEQKPNVFFDKPEFQRVKRNSMDRFELGRERALVSKNFENLWINLNKPGMLQSTLVSSQMIIRPRRDFPQLLLTGHSHAVGACGGISTGRAGLNNEQPFLFSDQSLFY